MPSAKKSNLRLVNGKNTKGKKPENPSKTREELRRLSQLEREYFKALHQALDEIYNHASNVMDWTWGKLANEAGLSYMTVSNLGERTTKWPRFFTIFKLAKAVGWKLALKGTGSRKTVILRKAS